MKKRATKFVLGSIKTLEAGKQVMIDYLKKFFVILIVGITISLSTKPMYAQSIIKNWDRAYAQSNLNCHSLTAAIRTSDGGYLFAGHYRNCNVVEIIPSDGNAYWVVKTSGTGALQWQR